MDISTYFHTFTADCSIYNEMALKARTSNQVHNIFISPNYDEALENPRWPTKVLIYSSWSL